MNAATILHAKRLNHGQSEVYLESDGKESAHRILSANELFTVTALHCSPDAFTAFHKVLQVKLGDPATLAVGNLDEIATALKLAEQTCCTYVAQTNRTEIRIILRD